MNPPRTKLLEPAFITNRWADPQATKQIRQKGLSLPLLLSWGVSSTLVFGATWLELYFPQADMATVLFHLVRGVDGLRVMGPVEQFTFVAYWFLFPWGVTLVLARNEILSSARFELCPVPGKGLLRGTFSVLALLISAAHFSAAVDLSSFVENFRETKVVSRNYIPPSLAMSTSDSPKNLVLIYVEGLETGLLNGDLVGENLLEPLDSVTQSWSEGPSFAQAPGTMWTIGGIVSSQCSIPLVPPKWIDFSVNQGRHNHNTIAESAESFLPGASCLGDVLASRGYQSVFLGGAPKSFAGKGDFLVQHGYSKVMGWRDWEALGESGSEWGIPDHRLIDYAIDELDRLHGDGTPFNLTILTVDSHFPKGNPAASCDSPIDETLQRSYFCSAMQVARLISHAEREGYFEDTVFVVMGDHLVPEGELSEALSAELRSVFFRFSSREAQVRATQMNHFDVLPTLLDLLGMSSPEGRLGLGRSILSYEYGRDPVLPRDSWDELQRVDPIFEHFWGLVDCFGGPGTGSLSCEAIEKDARLWTAATLK